MKIQWFILTFLVVFILGIGITVVVIDNKDVSEVDIIAMNEIVKTVESKWEHLNQEKFMSNLQDQPFSIINNNGEVLYETSNGLFTNLYDAIRNRDSIVDVMQKGNIVGKVIFHNNDQELIKQMKDQLKTILSLIFGIILLLIICYILYLNRTLIKPFSKLQNFATNVARGNLDIPLDMDKNNIFGAFTESFDLMREELAAARQREYESNRSKKELVATLSHDIKTPVASIKAVSELMLMQAKDEKVMNQVSIIYSKAEQINLLVTDMFHATLEELQQLKVKVNEESSQVLVEMIENVNYDNQISYDLIPDCIILTDVVRIQQVLDNIISNSYKYAGTSVKIKSQIKNKFLELYIMDYGPGISEDELPLLFNKYYRGKNVEGKNGSGLGLYISKYFIENMDGEIECYNRDDGFTVVLRIKLA